MKGKKLIKMINNKVKAIMTQSRKEDNDANSTTKGKLKCQYTQHNMWVPQASSCPDYER